MVNSVIIDLKDTVAVAIEKIEKGDEVTYKFKEEKISFTALENIPIYHKIAIQEISKNDPIVKYGEHIGLAKRDIKIGEHVHTHNVESHRENL